MENGPEEVEKLRARVAELEANLEATRALGHYCALRAFPAKSAAVTVPTRRADCDARSACFGLDPTMLLREVEYVSVDVETTGTTLATDRVIEIAFVRGNGRDAWSTLINPGVSIPPGVTAVHGIDDATIAGAPTFAEAWSEAVARGFVVPGKTLLLGYNAAFDQAMVCAELVRAGRDAEAQAMADAEWLDPFVIVRDVDKFAKGKKLADACERRGIKIDMAHRALADAGAAHVLFQHLVSGEMLERRLVDFLRHQRDRRAAQEADFLAWQARQQKGRAA